MTSGPTSPTLFEQCHRSFYVPFQHSLKYKYEGDKANSLTSPPNDTIIWTEKGVLQLAWSHQFLKTLVDGRPGFELTTSRSADRRSSNRANRASRGFTPREPLIICTKQFATGSPPLSLVGWGAGGQPLVPRLQMERPVKGLPNCSKIFLYFFFHLKCLF